MLKSGMTLRGMILFLLFLDLFTHIPRTQLVSLPLIRIFAFDITFTYYYLPTYP